MCPRVVLCILDGWGINPSLDNNGLSVAHNWDQLIKNYPNAILQASEQAVGLPANQMGNSEVGHMTIGLGRVLLQDLTKIDHMIETGKLWKQPEVQNLTDTLKITKGACHVMGLLSPGGVHSHQDHISSIIDYLLHQQIPVCFHGFLDGRDTPPQSSLEYASELQDKFSHSNLWQWSTISGRYFAMDRDLRWDRTLKAYNALVYGNNGNSPIFIDPISCIKDFYKQTITDEFIPPIVNKNYLGVKDEDGLWMANFRSDRVRQLLSSLLLPDFNNFTRKSVPRFSAAVGMGEYSNDLNSFIPSAIKRDPIYQSLGEILSINRLKQLRIAETEKYAHVTFFFNGGREEPFEGEERILVPSPQVATYDLMPEMSAAIITNKVVEAMEEKTFDLIVVNYANTDMVGHTGIQEAILKAVQTVDQCVQNLAETALTEDWTLIITSDHGNAESMVDDKGNPHTAHTCNPVPIVIINGKMDAKLQNGTLADVAPTILELMNLDKPKRMTGVSLLIENVH